MGWFYAGSWLASTMLAFRTQPGETIEIQASRSAKFKPGKVLKDSLN